MKKAKMLTRLKRMTGVVRQPVDKKTEEKKVTEEKTLIMKGKITAKVLNVRSDASLDSEVLGKLKKNDLVEIVGIEEKWYEIQFSDSSAFVSAKFVNPLIKSGVVTVNSKQL